MMPWDAFISHASEDKETIARPLATTLISKGLKIWFDEFTLTVGDSLRRSIDHGLTQSRFGIVILSKHFFNKEWAQRELDGLTAREITSGNVILPVWHGINRQYVTQLSPTLGDSIGVSTDLGIEFVADELYRAIAHTVKENSEAPTVPVRHSNLEIINVSVDEDACFYSAYTDNGVICVEPTAHFHPYVMCGGKDIFPIIDIKLRNRAETPSFLYRISLHVVSASQVVWDKTYHHPCGPVDVSAKYHVLLDSQSTDLTRNVSLRVPGHDVERFQVRLASDK